MKMLKVFKKEELSLTPENIIKLKRQKFKDIATIAYFLQKLVVMVIMIWVLFGVVFGIAPVKNDNMMPKLRAGDVMLYYRLNSTWHTQDVIVFEKDGIEYVGRIIAVGGDSVEVTEEATLKINGSMVIEPDIYYTTPKYENEITYPIVLKQDEFFVLCDYREGAKDSRFFGPVNINEVKGKVITVLRRSGL